MIIVSLHLILIALICFNFSSALYDKNKEAIMMTEEDWSSHGPWIVTVGN